MQSSTVAAWILIIITIAIIFIAGKCSFSCSGMSNYQRDGFQNGGCTNNIVPQHRSYVDNWGRQQNPHPDGIIYIDAQVAPAEAVAHAVAYPQAMPAPYGCGMNMARGVPLENY